MEELQKTLKKNKHKKIHFKVSKTQHLLVKAKINGIQGNFILDTFNAGTQQFSEHYGQIPIGLACHVIFVTEDNGNYRYAIMPKTIAANDVYSFTLAQTTVGTEAQLKAAINALP